MAGPVGIDRVAWGYIVMVDSAERSVGVTRLRMSGADTRIRVAKSPFATVMSVVADLYGGRAHGVPAQWRRMAAVPGMDARSVLAPLFAAETPMFPDCLSPVTMTGERCLEEELQEIEAVPGEVLLAQLDTIFRGRLPKPWQPAAAAPTRWLRDYTEVLRRTWSGFAPVWRGATVLFDREVERVGAATVITPCVSGLVTRLGARYRFRQDCLYLYDRHPVQRELGRRTLVLVPLVSGITASLFDIDGSDIAWIGYPLPGVGNLHHVAVSPEAPAKDKLDLVVGRIRAKVLRSLDVPATMTSLARSIGCSPPNATYHCQRLEAAGLLRRDRRGMAVYVHRTPAAEQLMDLLT